MTHKICSSLFWLLLSASFTETHQASIMRVESEQDEASESSKIIDGDGEVASKQEAMPTERSQAIGPHGLVQLQQSGRVGKAGRVGKEGSDPAVFDPTLALSTDDLTCEGHHACKDTKHEVVNSNTIVKCRGEKACEKVTLLNTAGVTNVLVLCQGKEACKKLKLPATANTWTVTCDHAFTNSCKEVSFGGATQCQVACPTTMAEAVEYWQAAPIPHDTMTCMNKVLCYDQLPINIKSNNAFKCECVWRSGMRSKHPMCSDYNACLMAQEGDGSTMVLAMKSMEKAVFRARRDSAGLIQSDHVNLVESADWDTPGCVDPLSAEMERYTCACWITWLNSCEAGQVECWRRFVCAHEGVCRSYQFYSCAVTERFHRRRRSGLLVDTIESEDEETALDDAVGQVEQSARSNSNTTQKTEFDTLDESLQGKASC